MEQIKATIYNLPVTDKGKNKRMCKKCSFQRAVSIFENVCILIPSKFETLSEKSRARMVTVRKVYQMTAIRGRANSGRSPPLGTENPHAARLGFPVTKLDSGPVKLEGGERCGMDTTANIANVDMGRTVQRVLLFPRRLSPRLTPYDQVEQPCGGFEV